MTKSRIYVDYIKVLTMSELLSDSNLPTLVGTLNKITVNDRNNDIEHFWLSSSLPQCLGNPNVNRQTRKDKTNFLGWRT